MCKYCEGSYLIGNPYDYNDALTIIDATLIMYSYDYKYRQNRNEKPINYCPMCGRDLVEGMMDKLRSERQYE